MALARGGVGTESSANAPLGSESDVRGGETQSKQQPANTCESYWTGERSREISQIAFVPFEGPKSSIGDQ